MAATRGPRRSRRAPGPQQAAMLDMATTHIQGGDTTLRLRLRSHRSQELHRMLGTSREGWAEISSIAPGARFIALNSAAIFTVVRTSCLYINRLPADPPASERRRGEPVGGQLGRHR
jgi:hypothetical protein